MDDRETRYEQEENFLITSLLGDIRADISFLGLTLWDLVWIVVQTVLCGAILSFMPLNIFLKLILGVIGVVFIFLNRFLQFPYRRKRSKRYRKEAKSGTGEKIGEILNVEADGPFYKSGREWQIAFRVKAPPWNEALFSHKKRRIISFAKFLRACMQRHVKVMISTEQSPDFHWDVWNSKRQKNAATHGIQKLKLQRLDYFESLARTQKKETKQTTYYMGLSVNEIRLPRQERDGEEGLEKTQIERRRIIEDLKEIRNLTDILQEGNLLCTTISGFSVTEAVARQWAPLSWNAWKAAQGNWEVDGVNFQTEAIKPQHVTSTTNEKSSRGKMIFTWVRKMIGSSFRWLAGMWSNILAFLKQKKHNRKEKSLVSANVIEERKMILLPENTEENMTISAVNKVRDTEACAESAENRFEKNEHVKRYMENEGIAQTATPFLLFTSPSPCGRSFLASNIGVANASEGKKILLIDFSKDAGSLSYVNPSIEEESNGWIRYETKLVPYLTIIVMSENNMATVDEVIKQVLFWSENYAMVLVDVPWEHPWRERLCSIGKPIAIVDSDYHHWVQWERATRWSGEVWLNQSEIDMTPLIQEVWGVTPSRMFPTFQQAKKSLYRGRPLALEENMRENFLLPHDWFQ